MTSPWREHEEALEEYRAAARWYEKQRFGWGGIFMDAVDAAIETILDPAITWGYYRGQERTPPIYSRSVAGFPFDIIYVVIDDEVFVIAYAHERRRPGYWDHRLNR